MRCGAVWCSAVQCRAGQCSAVSHDAAPAPALHGITPARERRTGCVSELVLLPFYPVLQGLGVAPCDLNFLLDGLLVHVGHATLELPGGREVCRGGRASESGEAGKSRGPRREGSCGHRGEDGQRQRWGEGSNGDRRARCSCNCVRKKAMGRRPEGVVVKSAADGGRSEVRRRTLG